MARTRKQEELAPATEWSCPLCTLLNVPGDDRCMACDSKRPDMAQQPAAAVGPVETSPATTEATTTETSSSSGPVYREAAGVFFSSSMPLERCSSSGSSAPAWLSEPRLAVNRRRGRALPAHGGLATFGSANNGADAVANIPSGMHAEHGTASVGIPPASTATLEEEERHQVEKAQADTGEDDPVVEEPCFNLLGPGAAIFPSGDLPALEAADVSQSDAANSGAPADYDFGFGVPEADEEEGSTTSSPPPSPAKPQYPGFMPASRVHVEEPAIEDKLASAGLDLSDSEDENDDASARRLQRRKSREPADAGEGANGSESTWECDVCTALNPSGGTRCETCNSPRLTSRVTICSAPETTWECDVCTNLNPSESLQCQTCGTKRNRDANSSLSSWECSICTHVNPGEYLQCKACDTKRTNAATASESTWGCNVCTNINHLSSPRCEACGSKRQGVTEKTPGVPVQEWECSICTNFNPPGATRCEICDTSVGEGESKSDRVIDLASSPEDKGGSTSNNGFNDRDLENPYLNMSQYEEYTTVPDDPDYVEDISDNEPMPSYDRPPVVRPDLKEFEHFVCVEDLRGDMACNVNYNQMFGGTRARKSYSDRLAMRQIESQKRKRDAARKAQQGEANGPPARRPKGKTAARAGRKKGKATTQRRASTNAKTAKTKRARKSTAGTARRASTASSYTTSINHYETSAADLGDDLSTMAWEGIGSAGYL